MNAEMIGDLRHRITLERVIRTADGGGGVSESWIEEATVWVAIGPGAGREGVDADRLAGRHLFEIRLRYRAGVEPAMRFRLGARVFHILSVENIGEQNAWLTVLCEERDL